MCLVSYGVSMLLFSAEQIETTVEDVIEVQEVEEVPKTQDKEESIEGDLETLQMNDSQIL